MKHNTITNVIFKNHIAYLENSNANEETNVMDISPKDVQIGDKIRILDSNRYYVVSEVVESDTYPIKVRERNGMVSELHYDDITEVYRN